MWPDNYTNGALNGFGYGLVLCSVNVDFYPEAYTNTEQNIVVVPLFGEHCITYMGRIINYNHMC